MKLHVLLLTALPMCLAQFSIQGPSDGHRQAQGLKFSQEKGIEYTDQSESLGAGDFTIQGATDGNSDFRIQGATDGHSGFDIQGASDAGVNFHIQGATDGHSQSIIQGPYDANHGARPAPPPPPPPPPPVRAPAPAPAYHHQQPVAYSSGNAKSLSYNDPATGLRVNWKSYDRQVRPQAHPEQQYLGSAVPARAAASHPAPRSQAHSQPQATAPQGNYRVFNTVPQHIKHLLQFQSQIPYVNSIPEHLRFESLAAAQGPAQHQPAPQYQEDAGGKPPYRSKQQGPSRHRRQAPQRHQPQRLRQPPAEPQPHYSSNLPGNLQALLKFQSQTPYVNVIPEQYRFDVDAAVQSQAEQVQAHYRKLAQEQAQKSHARQRREAQHPGQQPQYQRTQPPAEPRVQYSTNVPSQIQQLLKYQSEIPYNIIANQIVYRPDKPYVPQPVQPQQQGSLPQAQYQGTGGAYEAQQSQFAAAHLAPQYGQARGGVHPVTENQY